MRRFYRLSGVCLLAFGLMALSAQAQSQAHSGEVLNRTQASKWMPSTVFFRGQTRSTQERNSCGVRFVGGRLMLAALVDTSGYASDVRQNYQGYLLTEVALNFDGHRLAPGAYGFGFVANSQFVALNLGGETLWTTSTHAFHGRHPVPLEMLSTTSGYELCSGLACVSFNQ